MCENERYSLVTIGIPVKDEASCINHMLKSLEDLDYPKEQIAIIFVDGHSTDGTYEVLAEWARRKKH